MPELTWKEFYSMLRDEINKGDSIPESVLRDKVYYSLRTIEQNWSYKWNEKLLKFKTAKKEDGGNVLELPDDFKSVISLSVSMSNFENCQRELQEQSPSDFSFSRSGTPYGFWIQGNKYIWLDSAVEPGTDGFLWYNRFTTRKQMEEELTNPILKYGLQALIGLTLQNFAAYCREPAWFESYGRMTEIGLKTMAIADEELRRASETSSFGGIS